MASALFRLLAVFALFLMPFGAGVGPAAAASHDPAQTEHCGGSEAPADQDKTVPAMHCAVACSALPVSPDAMATRVEARASSPPVQPVRQLIGGEPEIATPPPKDA